jgi:CBS domain-containing protein
MVKVREVMSSPVLSIQSDTLVKNAAAMLAERNVSGVPVVDNDRVVGVFSEIDVLKSIKTTRKDLHLVFPSISSLGIAFQEEVTQREILEAYEEVGNTPVKDVMSKEVVTVHPDITVNEAIVLMVERKIQRLPVVEDKKLVGIITRGDIIRGLAKERPPNNKTH